MMSRYLVCRIIDKYTFGHCPRCECEMYCNRFKRMIEDLPPPEDILTFSNKPRTNDHPKESHSFYRKCTPETPSDTSKRGPWGRDE